MHGLSYLVLLFIISCNQNCDCDIGLIGGVNAGYEYITNVEAVDDATNCTVAVPDIPEGRSYAGAAVVDGRIIFCGGFGVGLRHRECWSSYEGGWIQIEGLVEKRNLFTMTAVKEKIVVIGGSNDVGDLASVEVYEDGLWRVDPALELTSTRYGHCAVEYSNKMIVIGGVDSSRHTVNLVEMMDLNQVYMGWTALPSMTVKRGWTACSLVEYAGVLGVMVTGGWSGLGGDYLDTVEFLNLEFLEWEQLPSLMSGRSDHSLAVVGGMAVVIGGFGDGAMNTTEVLSTEGWTSGASLQQERYAHSIIDLGCG